MDAAYTQPQDESSHSEPRRYAFEDFVLDASRGALLRGGREIPLRKQAYEILLLLLHHPGQLVSKDFLMRSIWGESVVTENSITQCLREIRRAIDDHDLTRIRTVPKRGYIFDVPVTSSVALSGPQPTVRPLRWGWGVAAALVFAAFAWWTLRDAGTSPRAQIPPVNSIAVLPFVNMSANPELAYLANGLSEEILNQLAQLPDLVVIARTSSFAFRSEGADIATIGNRLNVAHVLEGSLRAQGSEVRVTAQLIDTASQAHIWSNVYERPLDDIFDLQLEIAAGVARELKGVLLTGDESRRSGAHIPHPDAYKAVLEGQTLYQRRMDGDLERARALFEKATELDPDYALAWTRLSAVIFLLFNRGDLSLDEALALGAPAARHAIELEPDLAEAQFRAGWFTSLSGDRENGRAMVERSFELEPHSPRTLAARAGRALFRGDALAALELQRKAVSLDPLSAGERLRLCGHLYHAGAFDEYWNELEVALRLNPAAEESTLQAQVAIQLLDGDWERASQRVDLVPEDMERHALRVMLGGFESQGTEASTEAEESSRWLTAQDSFVASIRLAEAWSFRGDTERAFGFLDEARTRILNRAPDELLTPNLQLTRLSHFLEPLHSDPRWSQWLDFIAGVLD